MALDSDYGLTGSGFSRLPEHIELTRGRFRVGNLYINRLSVSTQRIGRCYT